MKQLECGVCEFYSITKEAELARNKMTNSVENSMWKIPAYQRGYKWDKEQFVEFKNSLEDFIETADCKKKYFGQLIIHSNEEGDFEVVDGQQRLTTFMILAKIILDNREKISSRFCGQLNMLEDFVYITENQPRLAHQNINKKYIDQYVFLVEPCEENDHAFINEAFAEFKLDNDVIKYRKALSKTYKSQGIKNYKKDHYHSIVLAYDCLNEWYLNTVEDINKGYLIEGICNKIEISYLISLTFETAYESFLSLNVQGKTLSNYDVIKSVFLGELNKGSNNIESAWESEIENQDITESKIVDLIEIMLKLEYPEQLKDGEGSDLPVIKKNQIYSYIQKILKKSDDKEKRLLFDKLVKYIEIYVEIRKNNFSNLVGKNKYTKLNGSLKSLLDMNYVPFLPIVFEYIKSQKEDGMIEEIIEISKYIPFIYVTVFGQKSTKLTALSNQYISNLENGLERREALKILKEGYFKILPSTNFVTELSTNTTIKDHYIAKDVLLLLEKKLRIENKYEDQLEHTYPTSPNKGQWREFRAYKEYAHYIGNFVIIPAILNNKLKNSEFPQKKAIVHEMVSEGECDLESFEYAKKLYGENDEFKPSDVESRSKMYAEKLEEIFIDMNLLNKE